MISSTIVGIVNVTPDSFSDGGCFSDTEAALDHALRLAEDGAHVLDIGGESTRPGATPVPVQVELDRVIPVIQSLVARTDRTISIDTRKPAVARAAVAAGARIWNDVSALTYTDESISIAAELGCSVVLMHAKGDPATMQDAPVYTDVLAEVTAFLAGRMELVMAAGVARSNIILDPGIGFGKTLDHNTSLMGGLGRLVGLGVPVLLGASRKRFIASLDRDGEAGARLGGSIAAVLKARAQGVGWFRVHDVAATRQALAVWDRLDEVR